MNDKRSMRIQKSGLALVLGLGALWGCGSETARPVASPQEPLATTAQGVVYGGHTYYYLPNQVTWAQADESCTSMGMSLVTFDDAAEEQWAASQFTPGFNEWWIGLNSIGTEGWKWSGLQSTSTYANWRPGEPNNPAADCSVFTPYGWQDLYCNDFRTYVCESAPPKAAQYNGHDYLFHVQSVTRERARTVCREQGYTLATINNSAEDTWLKTQVPAGQSSWIGFNDLVQEGSWRWADPSGVTFLNWRPGEPNDTGGVEDCAVNNAPATGTASAGRWNDVSCGEKYPFICESATPPAGYGHFQYVAGLTGSATQGTIDYEFSLGGGEVLEIGTCGMPTAYAMGDTFLRLVGPDGLEVMANDDDCKGPGGSRIQYRVPACAGGTYVVKAGCFANINCEARLVFRVIPAPQP